MIVHRSTLALFCLLAGGLVGGEAKAAAPAGRGLTFACAATNDLFRSVAAERKGVARFDTAGEAVRSAPAESGVLILADGYPQSAVRIDADVVTEAKRKRLRMFVEFPESYPGIEFGPGRVADWERGVVASRVVDLGLPAGRIVALHGCHFQPATAADPVLVLARVAGFDTAVFGLPEERFPILFQADDGTLIATTRLSNFVTARYAPAAEWRTIWQHILAELDPGGTPHRVRAEPIVRPAFDQDAALPADAEKQALAKMAHWLRTSHLLISPKSERKIHEQLRADAEVIGAPEPGEPLGDGSLGIMEGYASRIAADGSQARRLPIRADCQAESAAVLALHAAITGDAHSKQVATNLLDYLYFHSELHQGVRADPTHPAFGLIGWGAVARAWQVATYGDDNARTLLATLVAAAALESDKWNASVAKALLANLRTTGKLGFRGDRIDIPQLEQLGWKHFRDAETVNYSPHFEAYLWACYLYAYSQTGEREFLDRTKTAIRMTMEAYPDRWRWGDHMERAHMLLTLAWLVRIEDTTEHRAWLHKIADDILADQQQCGAIRERLRESGAGHYVVPDSNEKYGTGETPLIQENGDPVSDQLYATPFVLLGLHEAAAATGDAKLKKAEDKLAEYLVRIQVRSDTFPYLNGTWFRAFDFERWDYWASSADFGWGAWSAEAGWGPAWTAIVLGLRAKEASLWELAAPSTVDRELTEWKTRISTN